MITRHSILLIALVSIGLPVSAGAAPCEEHAAAATVAAAPAAKKAEKFGAPVPAGEAVSMAKLTGSPDAFQGKTVVVEGMVRSACTKKGCWMELASADGKGPGARVKFKDYGFFVPKDSAGAKARLEGVVAVKTVAKKEVDHLEAEGATFAKAADGTAREIQIVANGVELVR